MLTKIKNHRDYSNALDRILEIIDAKPNDPQFEELCSLCNLVDAYEEEHFPIK